MIFFYVQILQCVSQLELLQLIGSKVRDHTTAVIKSVRSSSVIDTTPSKRYA